MSEKINKDKDSFWIDDDGDDFTLWINEFDEWEVEINRMLANHPESMTISKNALKELYLFLKDRFENDNKT